MKNNSKGIRLTVSAVLVFITLILALFIHGISRPQVMSKQDLRTNGTFLFDSARSINDFSLIDNHGQAFNKTDLKGRWTLIFFGFTYCPDVCPTTLALLKRFYESKLSEEQRNNLQIILVTVDPARDTVEKLNPYIEYFSEDFKALTGEFLDIHRFATQLNIPFSKVPGGGENYTVEHSGNVAILNPQGHYVGFFRPPLDAAKMARHVESLTYWFE